MKKLSLKVAGKSYDINAGGEFAKALEAEFASRFSSEHDNPVKTLLEAYIRKNYEYYRLQKELEELLRKLEIQ